MGNPFGKLNNDGLEKSEDRLGGSGFGAVETDLYKAVIKAMYAGVSGSGAQNVTVIATLENGKEYRETVYVTDRNGNNWFHPKKGDGSRNTALKNPLPGFTVIDDICMCTTEKPLCDQDFEEKVFNVYDFEAKKELPKNVQMATDVIGKTVTLAIQKSIENKSVKDGDKYVPTADTREVNNIEKVIHTESGFTYAEVRESAEEPKFAAEWLEKNKGQTRDKRSIKDGAAGQPGKPQQRSAPQQGATDGQPKKSLFGNK